MRSADCPTLVLFHEKSGTVVVAHCSRDSLLCRQEILTGFKDRQYSTVIYPAVSKFDESRISLHTIRAHIICGIAGKNFGHGPKHRQYGMYNQALAGFVEKRYGTNCFYGDPRDGHIELHKVIQAQLSLCGVTKVTHDGLDTFSDPRLHSNRARDIGRNGVLVTNSMK